MSKISMNSREFALLSETHLKYLVSQGIEISITDLTSSYTRTTVAKATPKKVDTKVSKPTKSHRDLIKVGDYIKVINKKDNSLVAFGKTKKYDKNAKAFVIGKKKYAIENCIKISKADYKNLSKKDKSKTVVSAKAEVKRLGEKDYTIVLAYLANKQDNKLNDLYELAKATEDKAELKSIRSEIKKVLPDFKLTAEQAVKEFDNLPKVKNAENLVPQVVKA